MINLLNSKTKLKPDFILASGKDFKEFLKYIPESEQEKVLDHLHSFLNDSRSVSVYIIHSPESFNSILTLRNNTHAYEEDFLPNYNISIKDEASVFYAEDYEYLCFGVYNLVIRYNSFFSNCTGPTFLKNKIYIIGITSIISIKTTRFDVNELTEKNIYLYIPNILNKN
jgi:hypothetical protein